MPVVSVRIDEKTKRTLDRSGINLSSELKKFLEDLAWKVELKERLNRLNQELEKVPPAERGFSSASVREDRDSH